MPSLGVSHLIWSKDNIQMQRLTLNNEVLVLVNDLNVKKKACTYMQPEGSLHILHPNDPVASSFCVSAANHPEVAEAIRAWCVPPPYSPVPVPAVAVALEIRILIIRST